MLVVYFCFCIHSDDRGERFGVINDNYYERVRRGHDGKSSIYVLALKLCSHLTSASAFFFDPCHQMQTLSMNKALMLPLFCGNPH